MIKFWTDWDLRNKYKNAFILAESIFILMPTTFHVERGFSHLTHIYTIYLNRLNIQASVDLIIKLYDHDYNQII